jgi:phosphonate transport system ATP-binding protein
VNCAVRLENLRVAAGARTLLQVPQLELKLGEQVAIVGPNGAGKSMLLRVMAGLCVPARGRVSVLGRQLAPSTETRLAPAQWRALRRDVGLVMQGLHLVPRLSARENVLVGALARLTGPQAWRSWLRWYPETLVAEADAALDALGLAAQAHTRADRLSGGERQKVGLARLALQQPRLVLADEPTAALDPNATAQVCAALRATAARLGQTLVTVVHDLELLPALATRVIGIAEGELRWDLPLAQVDAGALRALYGERRRHGALSVPQGLRDAWCLHPQPTT